MEVSIMAQEEEVRDEQVTLNGKTLTKQKSSTVVKLREVGDKLEGKFVKIERSAMYDDSFALHVIVDKEPQVAFVNKIVNDAIGTYKAGKLICVISKGMKKTEDGKKEYKDYDVFLEDE